MLLGYGQLGFPDGAVKLQVRSSHRLQVLTTSELGLAVATKDWLNGGRRTDSRVSALDPAIRPGPAFGDKPS